MWKLEYIALFALTCSSLYAACTQTGPHEAKAGHDVLVTQRAPLAMDTWESTPPTRHEEGSSMRECLCWPRGGTCDFPEDLVRPTTDTTFDCPETEICDGGPSALEGSLYHGHCWLPCQLNGIPSETNADCAEGWECREKSVSWGLENSRRVTFGVCVPTAPRGEEAEEYE